MDLKNIILVIKNFSTEQINMLMTKNDYIQYIEKLGYGKSKPTIKIHSADLGSTFNDTANTLNWAKINFENRTSIYARYCENEMMLNKFIKGGFNDQKFWYFDKENTSHECFEYILDDYTRAKSNLFYDNVSGYIITSRMGFKDRFGSVSHFVVGHNEKAALPWATWRYIEEYDNYEWGHYFLDEKNAMKDFFERGIEQSNVDLRDEYRNEMILGDIRSALEYDYTKFEISELINNDEFIKEATDVWYELDRSDVNDFFKEKLDELIVKNNSNLKKLNEDSYIIRTSSSMGTDIGYLHVCNISKEKIISIVENLYFFETGMEIGFDGLLKNEGAIILDSWDGVDFADDLIADYDMEFVWDLPMLYDQNDERMFEPPFEIQPSFNKNEVSTKQIEEETEDKEFQYDM